VLTVYLSSSEFSLLFKVQQPNQSSRPNNLDGMAILFAANDLMS
jgi:hypothetical protein